MRFLSGISVHGRSDCSDNIDCGNLISDSYYLVQVNGFPLRVVRGCGWGGGECFENPNVTQDLHTKTNHLNLL